MSDSVLLLTKNGFNNAAKILLKNMDESGSCKTDDEEILFLAAEEGQLEVVDVLLRRDGIKMNKKYNYDAASDSVATPLIMAATNGHEKVVKLLLERKGVEVNEATTTGVTPLYIAAALGHVKIVELLLQEKDIKINKASNNGVTPLLIASRNGHERVVELLLRKEDIDVNQHSKEGRDTPLSLAAWNGHKNVVKLLLENPNIKVNKAAKSGHNPLQRALSEGHHEIAALLKSKIKKPLNETEACVVCLNDKPAVVLVPCGHQILCRSCAHELHNRQRSCPIDRVGFTEILALDLDKIYRVKGCMYKNREEDRFFPRNRLTKFFKSFLSIRGSRGAN